MLKHPDAEVQFLIEMLEGQRDQAVAQAAAYFCMTQELQTEIDKLKMTVAKGHDAGCGEIGGKNGD